MNSSREEQSGPDGVDPNQILSMVRQHAGRTAGVVGHLSVTSVFQPIFSLAHNRIVGYEALMRASDREGHSVPPTDVFAHAGDLAALGTLEGVAHAAHFKNFLALGEPEDWLFLNADAKVFPETARRPNFLERLLALLDFPAHRVVIEVPEQRVTDETRLQDAVRFFRDRGFVIALDGFGVGHSNFDHVWTLQPDIVKLDRSMTAQAGGNPRVRRMMPVMVSLLHEAGSLVLMEGIETEAEALMAMDADADFVQGYFFGTPSERLADPVNGRALLDGLWRSFQEITPSEGGNGRQEIAPYRNALGYAATLLESGIPLERAVGGLVDLPGVECCFLLDREGRQIGDNVVPASRTVVTDRRFQPLARGEGANWSRRYYFRRALEHPGRVQVTRPYLSITGVNQCVTVSIATLLSGELRVLCADVAWRDHGVARR